MLRDANSDVAACVAQSNQTTQPIDDQVYDLAQNWQPSGYYEPEMIRQGVAAVQAVLSQAFDILNQAQLACQKAPGCEFPTWSDRYGALLNVTNQSKDYLATCDQAETSAAAVLKTPYIVAPDFKKWTLDALGAASNAIGDSVVVACVMPWWASAIVGLMNAVGAAATVLRNIAGVAADAVNVAVQTGKAVAQTIKGTFDFLAFVTTWWPLGLLLAVGVGYGVYRHRKGLPILPTSVTSWRPSFMRQHQLTDGGDYDYDYDIET